MKNILKKLKEEGLTLISSEIQIKNGTYVFQANGGFKYAMYKSGYVRKKNENTNCGGYWGPSEPRWYQLNLAKTTLRNVKDIGKFYSTVRVLVPGDYLAMSNIIIRVLQKSEGRYVKPTSDVEMTMEEICNALGKNIKIIK